ncbi:hypothetical protein DPMN_115828 [Dreissena polymorpha]|uniref:Uncharacterized protein n=1 Tax=Dreissena polymorpha TaxID=45954 RepID=A0A9D4KMF5_DREPO|nr:hypothetical protein DPMN_115828 [Dreissena polymorpha]
MTSEGERDITRPIPRTRTPERERDTICPIPTVRKVSIHEPRESEQIRSYADVCRSISVRERHSETSVTTYLDFNRSYQ